MKKLSLYILIIVIIISGCSNAGNTNNIEEPQNTETAITQTPGKEKETLGSTESTTPNNDSTKTPEPIIPPWLEEKPDYAIEINNYDINGDKEKYLLQVKFEYEVDIDEFDSTNYFIDIDEINQLQGYYEIAGRSIIPNELKIPKAKILRVSEDGQRVLRMYKYNNETYVDVIDIVQHQVLYQYKTKDKLFSLNDYSVATDGDLLYLRIYNDNEVMYVDVHNNKEMIKRYSVDVISPDGTKGAVIITEDDISLLEIYNIEKEELIESIVLEKTGIYITQWHKSSKILFHTFEGSYYYDINTKETKLIEPYFYYPVMSPDGEYVAMTRNYDFGILDYTDVVEHELSRRYSYNEGVYVKNMDTNLLTQIAPTLDFNQTAVQWVYVNKKFDNNKHRYFFPTGRKGVINVYSSSIKNSYISSNIFDGDVNTAWVEDEERNNTELEEKYDGKGIGEWIKIYKSTEVRLAYMRHEDGYRTDAKIGYMESFCISGIKIINGYAKSKEIYSANNRVKKAEVILSDGSSYIFDLEDNNLGFQTLDFGQEIETRQVVIKILDIYEGSKYNDTCISEVELIEVNKND